MKKYIIVSVMAIALISLSACSNDAASNEQSATEVAKSEESVLDDKADISANEDSTESSQTQSEEAKSTPGEVSAEPDNEISAVDASWIFDKISESVNLVSPVEMTDDFLENYYGIDLSLLDSYVCYMSEEATSAETVFIANVKDESDAKTIADCISMVRDDKAIEMQDYLPEQYEIVNKSEVRTSGSLIWLVISENADSINSIIESNIEG